jgi:hypothetical protein
MGETADKIAQMYRSGRSMAEIAKHLGKSAHQVQRHLDKAGVARRNRSDATYLKRNPDGDPFLLLQPQILPEAELLGWGLGLYWGEGTKSDSNSVRLGNTDPALLRKFVKFLTEICHVSADKIRYGLQIFQDINQENAVNYWLKELNIRREQLLPTIVVSPRQGHGTYRKKSQYGVVTVYFNNKKLRDALVGMLH